MASITTTSAKRALKDVNANTAAIPSKKKPKTASAVGVRTKDIQTIKTILADIQDPAIKSLLEAIILNPTITKLKNATSNTISPEKDEATLEKMTNGTIRTIQKLINDKLKWKASYKQLMTSGETIGGRVEVMCTEPAVFERIFVNATIKKAKDGKLSCNIATDDEAYACKLPFKGKSYRFNRSYLCAPFTASMKNNTLTFGFKYGIS